MHPILFRIPGVDWPLHTYGVLIVIGFLCAMFVAWSEARRQALAGFRDHRETILDFAFWALLGGMIGARIVFIAVNWREYFIDHPWDKIGDIPIPAVLVVWKGGLVFYGSALGGFAAFMWYTRKHNILGIERLKIADMMVVGVPLAHAFGRLGCVAAGCCWGDSAYHLDAAGNVIADIPLAAYFPEGSLAYTSLLSTSSADVVARMHEMKTTMPLIPVQLMESFAEACVFLILLVVRSRKWFHGQVLLSYGILYPIVRTFMETLRGDAERGYLLPGLSTSQFISLCVATASLIAIFVIRKRSMASTAVPAA